ncbi:hepcidin-like [Gouania willdenowi]|uniref:hepcidin-like n=1 Tax=Gouania willdenowi TaxID=441366 RepID=UPI0010554F36|nr:hepcidin-like [Gouania willdenowi]
MKTLSVFVAVAIVLTVMCSQQSSAVPVLQGEEQEETIFLEIPGGAMNETVMDFMKGEEGEEGEETIFLETPGGAMNETWMDNREMRKPRCSFRCRRGRCRLHCKL